MPFNGSGGFDPLPPPDYPAVAGETIFADRFNAVINDILSGLGQVIARDGQSSATANLPMGGFKHTGAADATAAGQYLVYGQASPLTLTAGAAATPSLSFTGDANTGLYSPGADILGVSAAGAEVSRWSAAQQSNVLGAAGTPSYSFTGDLNTGIWSPGADTYAVSTAGFERYRVDSTGRHMFGATTPGIGGNGNTYLTVGGATTVLQSIIATGGAEYLAGASVAEGFVGTFSNHTFSIRTNNTQRIFINNAGNVTINAPSSGTALTVSGNAAALTAALINGSTIGVFGGTGAGATSIGTISAHDFSIVSNNVNRMTFDTGGAVSITAPSSGHTLTLGATATSRSLQSLVTISGGSNVWALGNASNTADSGALIYMTVAGPSAGDPALRYDVISATSWIHGIDNSDGDAFVLSNNNVLGAVNRMRFAVNGHVSFASGAYTPTVSQAFTATPTFDCSQSNSFEFSGAMTANVTSCTLSNPASGQTISIRVKQDGTGGRTFASPAGAKISGSVGATAGAASILTLTYSAMDARWEGAWVQLPA